MYEENISCLSSIPPQHSERAVSINLLPTEAYANPNNEGLPLHSTTYNAKPSQPVCFQNGSVYIQDSHNASSNGNGAVKIRSFDMSDMTLSQVYTMGYRSYLHKKQADESMYHFPVAPPDFDGSAPTNLEAVAQYVDKLAVAYKSVHRIPTPFNMYEHIILEAADNLSNTSMNQIQQSNNTNSPPIRSLINKHSQLDVPPKNEVPSTALVDQQQATEAFVVSLSLVNLKRMGCKEMQLLFERFRTSPRVASTVDSDVITSVLIDFHAMLMQEETSCDKQSHLISLVGMLVSSRSIIKEVLQYLNILEEFHAAYSNILPMYVSSASSIIDVFTLHSKSLCPILSPIDCFQEEDQRLKVNLSEGTTMQCFCVSADGYLLAAATLRGLEVYEVASGLPIANRESGAPEGSKSYWTITFSEDLSKLICSDVAGLNHTIYTSDLNVVEEIRTSEVSIPLDYKNGVMEMLTSPLLPSGSNRSLYFFEPGSCLAEIELITGDEKESFTMCVHVHQDFEGTLAHFFTESGDIIVSVTRCCFRFTQNGVSCYGIASSSSPWLYVHARWHKGTWSLDVNTAIVDLAGARNDQQKSLRIHKVLCLDGLGHVGSFALWLDADDAGVVAMYRRERRLESCNALVNFPLDEGIGMWVKEAVSCMAFTISETQCAWDENILVPCLSSAEEDPLERQLTVCMDPKLLLESRILTSRFKVYMILPSHVKGGDDVVVLVDRAAKKITRISHCPRSCSENIYALLSDESKLFVYQQRFSTFSSIRLHSMQCKLNELDKSGLLDVDLPANSVRWLRHEWYKKIYLEVFELHRIPLANTPLSFTNLFALADSFLNVKANTDKLYVVVILSLTLVHFQMLISADETHISKVATLLKSCCKKIIDMFPENIISETAHELLNAATSKSLTLNDKVQALLDPDMERSMATLKVYVTKESLFTLIHHIVTNSPAILTDVARRLIVMSRAETTSLNRAAAQPITQLMTNFVLVCVKELMSYDKFSEISQLVELFVEFVQQELPKAGSGAPMQNTILYTGCIPLFIAVAHFCPWVLTNKIEQSFLSILHELKGKVGSEETVSFTTREACYVFPPHRERDTMWRFVIDFSHANSVAVQKESDMPPLSIIRSDSTTFQRSKIEMSRERTFLKLEGGRLAFFGYGENNFTINSQFDFSVLTSWESLLSDCVHNLLVSLARHLIHKPKANDTNVPPIMRQGLNADTLRRHDINFDSREIHHFTFALDILNNVGDGRAFVDQVYQSMRGSIIPSMRPAIQALLAILIHAGVNAQQAEDELKLRWFSGEWGVKLQGPSRDATRTFLNDFANWFIKSICYQMEGMTVAFRRGSCDRRLENSLNNSRSISERHRSTSSRRSIFKHSQQSETLDQLKTLLAREMTPFALEEILVERTQAAIKMVHCISLLRSLLRLEDTEQASEVSMLAILDVLSIFVNVDSGSHYIESLNGAGFDLQMQVRTELHSVLMQCQELLIGKCQNNIAPQAVLTERATNGLATMQLLSILCHPFDALDAEIFNANFGNENALLKYLENHISILTSSLMLMNPWDLHKDTGTDLSAPEERELRFEPMGEVDLYSISYIYPNDFTIVIPQLLTSRSEEGVLIENNNINSVELSADEGWPLTWKDGMPRVFYYEVKIKSLVCKLDVGLTVSRLNFGAIRLDSLYFYSSSGDTHSISFPMFSEDDTVGCGFISTNRRIFFTLNGVLLGLMDTVPEKQDILFPTLRFSERSGAKVLVNFGTSTFVYDYQQLHPALNLRRGPTWYRVASTAAITLHHIAACACLMQEVRKSSASVFLTHCFEVVCQKVNKVTTFLMNTGIGSTNHTNSYIRIKQSVIFAVAEYSIMLLIATIRHIVNTGALYNPLPEVVGEMIFDAVSVLMLLPLRLTQVAIISILPEIIPHVRHQPDGTALANLVRTLFRHANDPVAEAVYTIPFTPTWCECDPRSMSIVNVQSACMNPESQRSIVLGNVLPRTGVVSFSVKISRRNMSKGHSLKGGYFIGVSVARLSPLSPTSNSQSWKTVKPPIVWAMHDTSPQLPHATNPIVKANNFQRTFGNDDMIRVVVDCDNRTVDFYRDDELLRTLFSNLPADIDLVPFVQVYNDDASVTIYPGEMTSPISTSTLLSAASVDVLRAMLMLEPFQFLVAKGICNELDMHAYPKVTLALFNSLPDRRMLQLRSRTGEEFFITVSRVGDVRCKFSVGNEANYEHLYNLHTPANPKITCSLDTQILSGSSGGLGLCIERLVAAVRRIVLPFITTQALSALEHEQRSKIIDEEKERWDFLFHGLRIGSFINIQRSSQVKKIIPTPHIPIDYTFSAAMSHPSFCMPKTYCGRLATIPSGSENVTTPFITIADPAVPSQGTFSIRCQLIRGHNGQILGGGYYFGLCTSTFNWKRKDLNSGVPEVWAIHDMDDSPWRLRHFSSTCTLPMAADPRCVIVSGDIIRLEINRDEGIMRAFRKPFDSEEISFGIIFDNLPTGNLHPFVHLFNVDSVAVLLPSKNTDSALRFTVQQPLFSTYSFNERRYCDGCAAQHLESRLSKQWYKCVDCADYALCKSCFDLCVHSHHTFTDMGTYSLVHTKHTPTKITKGMQVVIPATSCMYLRSNGCRMDEGSINCVAESIEDNSFAIWGLVFKDRTHFTATIETLDNRPLRADRLVFIGVGLTNEIMQLSRGKLLNSCFSPSSSVLTYCNYYSMRREINSENRHSHGFDNGSTITVELDVVKKTATFIRDWIVIDTCPIEFLTSVSNHHLALCFFVVFEKKGVKVVIRPESGMTMIARVEEANGSIVKVSAGDSGIRYVTPENCRLPLQQCNMAPEIGRLGYIYIDKRMVQCLLVGMENGEAKLCLAKDDSVHKVPLCHFLIDEYKAIANEHLIQKESDENGATLLDGFVVSRLLLILSCLCENEPLSPLVIQHGTELINLIKGLASVQINNYTPLNFLNEVRTLIAETANTVRWINPSQRLGYFVPTLGIDDRKRRFKPGMLVECITTGSSKDFYKVVVRKGEMLTLVNLETSESVEISYKNCIPVKQSNGKPWYSVSNGLPCSFRERTIRLTQSISEFQSVSIKGIWQGELVFPKLKAILFDLTLQNSGTGTAFLHIHGQKIGYQAIYGHIEYQRIVYLCLTRNDPSGTNKAYQLINTENIVSYVRRMHQVMSALALSDVTDCYMAELSIDAEGLCMSGVCCNSNSKTGSLVCYCPDRPQLISSYTDMAHIEPLPDCVDTITMAKPLRDLSETMHRLVILLARHLYLLICSKKNIISKELVENVFLFNTHPLTDRLVTSFVGIPQLFFMVCDASQRITNPDVRPWDAATLSTLITKTLLLRPESLAKAPESLIWDSLHAVVVAMHRCGSQFRHNIMRKVTAFVRSHRDNEQKIYWQLFSALVTYFDRNVLSSTTRSNDMHKDIAAGVDLILNFKAQEPWHLRNIPTQPLHCLVDIWQSLVEERPLPYVVDETNDHHGDNELHVDVVCAFGDYSDEELKVGKVMSSISAVLSGQYYYEVILPDRLISPFAVGWGTQAHCEVPSQHVGSDRTSFSFNGSEVSTKDTKEDYKITQEITPGCVLGCLLRMEEQVVAWSINGTIGPFIPIPIALGDKGLYAFVSTGICSGLRVRLRASEFEFVPDGYTDLAGHYTRVLIANYDESVRSSLPVQNLSFYSQIASYLSDLTEYKKEDKKSLEASMSATFILRLAATNLFLPKYSALIGLSEGELKGYERVIETVESCMATASRFVDLDSDVIRGTLSVAFLYLKPLVRRSFRQKLLINIPGVEKATSPSSISIRITELFSTLPRTPDVALHYTVLSQLYRQIGGFTEEQWSQSPLFKVNLYISGSGHAPIDMGGPYRQVWTFLAEELVRHPDKCYPHSDFHRNPLFCFVDNSQRVSLVPDSLANSSLELALFNFFGKIMGHVARAHLPLNIDFSPFLWKFLVDDVLTVKDYYKYVDSVVENSMEDDNFLLSGVAEEIIPNFAENIMWLDEEDLKGEKLINHRRRIAENCLVHSMDEQLNAIRSGLWTTLPRRVVRCLSWCDLERLVCGESNPSTKELKRYIHTQLNPTCEKYFWEILEEFTAEEKAALLCFASGQRRLPLIRQIIIQENNESLEHLPRAQSCSSLITIPPYTSLEMFREKLLLALQHQDEMELA
ncbi:unnamed protein product [Phytomonas sp. Hart1]|nr:unnamed protein product [Phytomonas sp. Hart1]|eukprot:CCW68460.1 unnamed protein product [Phytomonas sp. isolate Hart1]